MDLSDLMEWYLEPWKHYVVLRGRARRKEYWTFVLVNLLLSFALVGVSKVNMPLRPIIIILLALILFASIIPNIAVTVRRLHDTGRSGGWFFIYLVPVVGSLILLYFMCEEGYPGRNAYGPDPKGAA